MNSPTFLTRLEIQLYSTLISIMSGINHLKAPAEPPPQAHSREILDTYQELVDLPASSSKKAVALNWETIQQTLLSLILWIILGFAAGFLIGMIRPG